VYFISDILYGDKRCSSQARTYLEVEREASHLDPLHLRGWAAPGDRVELTSGSEEGNEIISSLLPVYLSSKPLILRLLIITQIHPFIF